ncbi:MAG: D-hexose-6-phosphate mutarotase [Sedimenticolaceae bacterium]
MNIKSLNADFGVADRLNFVEGPGGLIQAHVRNIHAEAVISTYAGQVLSYQPMGDPDDLLFVSEAAYYAEGEAIKGGVPICWPWFGPDPEGLGRPSHGFVRNRQWNFMAASVLDDNAMRLVLGLESSDETRAIWPYDFSLRIEITVGRSLRLDLKTTNTSDAPFDLTQALHSYFRVGDIRRTDVLGLEGKQYIDKLESGVAKTQVGVLSIEGEVDRIYAEVSDDLIIEDPGLERRIVIRSSGSNSAVVWNPWAHTAAKMADLGDEDFQHMLCVETTNAGEDVVHVNPGETCLLGAEIWIRRD